MNRCPSCNAGVPARDGPGRPGVYCSEPCRRAAEFAIRRLTKRIDDMEVELREVSAGSQAYGWYANKEHRAARVSALRCWLRQDERKLRQLLGESKKSRPRCIPAAYARKSDGDPA
jgi:hypothetical protein